METSRELPNITIIVPVRPEQEEIEALKAVARLNYPPERLELLVARGRQPAVQRNEALRQAQGEFVYFLDDDAVPDPDNLRRAVDQLSTSELCMVGGPNLCPADAPFVERVFALVLSSWLAFGPSRARYQAIGNSRISGEKELILCNLMARRADVLEAGGFDESLYPNEENALMDGLQKLGRVLIYDPELVVYRRPRSNLRDFANMLKTYGRGRAEQFRRHPTPGSVLNFVPPLFVLYLVLAPWLGLLGAVPIAAYGVALIAQTVHSGLRHGWKQSLVAAHLIVLTHILYGLGFWRGLFTKLNSPDDKDTAAAADVVVERLKHLGSEH